MAGLISFVFLLAHFTTKIEVGDEGVSALGAWRIASGQVPYRDFFEIITPLSLYVLALAYKVFGVSVLAGRVVSLLYGIMLLLGTYLVSKRFVSEPLLQAVPIAILAPFGVGLWPLPSHHWLVDIFLLFSLLCLDRGLCGGGWHWTFFGGTLCGSGILSLQDQGGYALMAVTAAGAIFWKRFPRRWLIAWLGGVVTPPSLLYLTALNDVPIKTIFYDTLWFPATRYYGIPGNVVGFSAGLRDVAGLAMGPAWSVAPLYAALTLASSVLLFLLPFIAVAGLGYATMKKGFSRPRALLLWAFTASFVGAILHRWSLMNIGWSASLPAIAMAAGLDALAISRVPFWRGFSRAFALLFLAIMVGFSLYRIPMMTPSNLHAVSTPSGGLATLNQKQAESLQGYIDAIIGEIPPGAPAFIRGYVPFVSVLTRHPNPTPFNIFTTPGYNTEQQSGAWIRSLEERGVDWGFSNLYTVNPSDPVDIYLLDNFKVAWQNSEYVLWRRVKKDA